MATFYLDFENGNDANAGTSFATRWKTITSGATAARTAPGDEIRIMKSPDPVSLGVNGTFTKGSPTITLSGAVTANIDTCEVAWTANANVTTATTTSRKEGSLAMQATIATAFTTGVACYRATGTLDLSAYQNVSFWIRSSANLSAGVVRIDLCSDTIGAVPVHSIVINTQFLSVYKQVTWKNGAPLSSAIRSVSLVFLSDPGTPVISIDNIIACNDLHHGALIGTSSSATDMNCYPIRSINGTTVVIESEQNNIEGTNTSRGWSDTTTTTLAYVRDTIPLTTQQTFQESGTAANRITYSGGWDRTSMSTQDGMTFVKADRNIQNVQTFNVSAMQYLDISRIGFLFGATPIQGSASTQYNRFTDIGAYGCNASFGFNLDNYIKNIYWISNDTSISINGNVADGVYVYGNTGNGMSCTANGVVKNGIVLNNSSNGISVAGCSTYYNIVSRDNGSTGIAVGASGYGEIYGLTTSGNTSAGITVLAGGLLKVHNANLTDSTPFVSSQILSGLYLSRYGSNVGLRHASNTTLIQDNTSIFQSPATRSYQHSVLAATNTNFPIIQTLQPFAVSANSLVTFKIWVQRSSTAVEGRIRLVGYVTPGVDSDVISTITAGANTWEELTVTCIPNAPGVVLIQFESYSVTGGTGNVYFSNATVTQV